MELQLTKINRPEPIRIENLKELEQQLVLTVAHYNGLVITEDQIPEMKKVLAELRKLKKQVSDERIRVKKIWMQPLDQLEADAKRLTSIIDEPIEVIDDQIKAFDEARRKERLKEIRELYEAEPHPAWLPLETIMDPKWLNASTTMKSIQDSLYFKAFKIREDLQTLAGLAEGSYEAMEIYKNTLDINQAIRDGQRMAEIQKRKLEAEKEAEKPRQDDQNRQEGPSEVKVEEIPAWKEKGRQWRDLRAFVTEEEAELCLEFLDANGIIAKWL